MDQEPNNGLDKDDRTRLWPNLPDKSKVGYQGNPDPWRVTKYVPPPPEVTGDPPGDFANVPDSEDDC